MATQIVRNTKRFITHGGVRIVAPLLLGLGSVASVHAAEIVVKVNGISAPFGQIGCALFPGPAGFPMDNSNARQLWLPADSKGVVCRFDTVSEGSYVVSIGHDVNNNKKVDTNFVGMPTEQWGVSNNVRPALRAPRFDEAEFNPDFPLSAPASQRRCQRACFGHFCPSSSSIASYRASQSGQNCLKTDPTATPSPNGKSGFKVGADAKEIALDIKVAK